MERSSKAVKSADPVQGREGRGKENMNCAAEETKHDGIVLRKGPAQAGLAPWATCLFAGEGRKEGRERAV